MLNKTNVYEQLNKVRDKSSTDLIADVKKWLEDSSNSTLSSEDVKNATGDGNNLNFDLLESQHIYHIDQIEKICVDYRLRFLDAKYYKSDIPQQGLAKISYLNQEHQTELQGFKIMAPSKLFKLENADDPLLFAPIGNGYYYFIHKWGNDLHPLRRMMMWPVKNLENFMFTTLVFSIISTFFISETFMNNATGTEFFLLFLFVFKWIVAVAMYYGFAKGKNFNESIWKSKYYNA
jgi:hypothetical protein